MQKFGFWGMNEVEFCLLFEIFFVFKNTERNGIVMVLIIVLMIAVYFFPIFRSRKDRVKVYYGDFVVNILISVVISFLITYFVFIGIGEVWVKYRYESKVDLVAWDDSTYLKKDRSNPLNYIVLGKVRGRHEPMVVRGDKLCIFQNSSDRKLVKYTAPKRKLIFPIIFPGFDFEHVRYDAYIPTIE